MDFELLFRNRLISIPFELEKVEFRIPTPDIPVPEKSQKECGLRLVSIRTLRLATTSAS